METLVPCEDVVHAGHEQGTGGAFRVLFAGFALERVERLKLEDLAKDDGDETIWTALDSRFPDSSMITCQSASRRSSCWRRRKVSQWPNGAPKSRRRSADANGRLAWSRDGCA